MKYFRIINLFVGFFVFLCLSISCGKTDKTIVEPEHPDIQSETNENVFTDGLYDVRIHPQDKEFVIAIYSYRLSSPEDIQWAPAFINGIETAAQYAETNDRLAVGFSYTDGTVEVYAVESADYRSYIDGTASIDEYLGKIEIIR